MDRVKTIEGFATLRILRVLPALAPEVLLSTFLLGAVITDLPLRDYPASPLLRPYLFSAIGYIHFLLPGVFLHNPIPGIVNISLGTISLELSCYFLLMATASVGLFKRPAFF